MQKDRDCFFFFFFYSNFYSQNLTTQCLSYYVRIIVCFMGDGADAGAGAGAGDDVAVAESAL